MVKCSGAEWNAFYQDKTFWKDSFYHEDEVMKLDGEVVEEGERGLEHLPPEMKVEILSGIVRLGDRSDADIIDLETYFRQWKKAQDYSVLMVQVPKARETELRAFLKSQKCKVL